MGQKIVVVIIILLLLGAVGGVYWFLIRDNNVKPSNPVASPAVINNPVATTTKSAPTEAEIGAKIAENKAKIKKASKGRRLNSAELRFVAHPRQEAIIELSK